MGGALSHRRTSKVIILGGGLAGLAAAAELHRRSPELTLEVLEARQRLGGRILTERDPLTGEPLDLGAEMIHGRPPGLLRALRRHGVAVVEGDEEQAAGDSPLETMPRVLAPELHRAGADRSITDALRAAPIAPWQRQMLAGYTEGFYLAPPSQASARAIARLERGAAAIHGERAAQLRDGYGALIDALVAPLPQGTARPGTIAHQVTWGPRGVQIRARSAAGAELPPRSADAAIVALPFTALDGARRAGGIRFRPTLPAKRRAAQSLRMGVATKVFVRFAERQRVEPFFMAPGSSVPVWWTPATPGSTWLVGWAGGAAAEALDRLADRAVLHRALHAIAEGAGLRLSVLARELTGFFVASWGHQPFIEGGYAWVPVGADGAMAELARPVGRALFFAGEATDADYAGTTHGAYESGVRAATELLAARG